MALSETAHEIYTAKYHALTGATASAPRDISRGDFKRAADAIYYLGGGWPNATSRGRMEILLDNFVGMYRILDFIGRGDMVVEHLKGLGVKVSLDPEFKIKNRSINYVELDRQFKISTMGISKAPRICTSSFNSQ